MTLPGAPNYTYPFNKWATEQNGATEANLTSINSNMDVYATFYTSKLKVFYINGERCTFIDYISEEKDKILSVEKWEGEVERSIGEKIVPEKIKITDEIPTKNIGYFLIKSAIDKISNVDLVTDILASQRRSQPVKKVK